LVGLSTFLGYHPLQDAVLLAAGLAIIGLWVLVITLLARDDLRAGHRPPGTIRGAADFLADWHNIAFYYSIVLIVLVGFVVGLAAGQAWAMDGVYYARKAPEVRRTISAQEYMAVRRQQDLGLSILMLAPTLAAACLLRRRLERG
jgi:hypothetical protein